MPDQVWTKLTIQVPPALEDPLSDFLTTLTGRGVCIYDAQGGGSTIEAYLSPDSREDHLLRIGNLLESFVQMEALFQGYELEQQEVPEEDWMEVFRSQHTTVRVSDRLTIRPTWCEPAPGREIILDPGLAFGTGSHPTTRMCLALLDSIVDDPPPGRMFDLGTGSGILALAGAHLGIKEILAADIDPVAVKVTLENVQINDAGSSIQVIEGGVERAEGLYDIIAANISASLLERMAPLISQHIQPGGHLILSGILEDELAGVLEAFSACGLEKVKVLTEKVWIAALLVTPMGNK